MTQMKQKYKFKKQKVPEMSIGEKKIDSRVIVKINSFYVREDIAK